MSRIYLIGSLRNPDIQALAGMLRRRNHEVFDDWHAAGPEADDHWQAYEKTRRRPYDEALASPHARMVFEFDKRWLDWADTGVLIMPAGKSGHLELGYMIGSGKRGFVLFTQGEPERYDVMYNFASGVYFDAGKLIEALNEAAPAA